MNANQLRVVRFRGETIYTRDGDEIMTDVFGLIWCKQRNSVVLLWVKNSSKYNWKT